MKIIVVAGARPNFMKIAPIMKQLQGDLQIEALLVHTGQHYDLKMSGQFFEGYFTEGAVPIDFTENP